MSTKKIVVNNRLVCSKCNITKYTEDFTKNKYTHSGFNSYCKACKKKNRTDTKRASNGIAGVTGIFRNVCPQCKKEYNTKFDNKVFCSTKCTKKNWYESNKDKK